MKLQLQKPLFFLLLLALSFRVMSAENTDPNRLTEAETKNMLRDYIDTDHLGVGIVVGTVNEQGSRVVSHGKLDNGTDRDVDGDTLFQIASITKVFTALLLQDMIECGEMKLEDPVQKYLPSSVRLPTYQGKQITLLHLATHTSGLPREMNNLTPASWRNPQANYTVEQWHAFLSHCRLPQAPGTKRNYSNVEMYLLGYVIALEAGKDYETLVLERICRPLGMVSTRVTLTPELRSRLAVGHAVPGRPVCGTDTSFLPGAGGLLSSANDLLKFISAAMGLTQSPLTPLMQKAQAVHTLENGARLRLAWFADGPILSHGGDEIGFTANLAFDSEKRRGIVVLANCSNNGIVRDAFRGWREGRSPKPADTVTVDPAVYDRYVGQYQNDKGEISTIRRERDRLLARWIGRPDKPCADCLSFEIFPQSERVFSNAFWSTRTTFVCGADGLPIKLLATGENLSTEMTKISTNLPTPPALVRVDAKTYDGYVGQYRHPWFFGLFHIGPRLSIQRETDEFGDHLVGSIHARHLETYVPGLSGSQNGGELFPQTETTFWSPFTLNDPRITFVRNKQGETTGSVIRMNGTELRADRITTKPAP